MDKKSLLFIALAIIIWVFYMNFVAPLFWPRKKPEPNIPAAPVTTQPNNTTLTAPATGLTAEPVPVTPTALTTIHPEVALTRKTIETDYLIAVFSNQGARLESLSLKKYVAAKDKNKNLALIRNFQSDRYPLTLTELTQPGGPVRPDLATINWEVLPSEKPDQIIFLYTTPEGLEIRKEFHLPENSYALDIKVFIKNISEQRIQTRLSLTGVAGISYEDNRRSYLMGLRGYLDADDNDWSVNEKLTAQKIQKYLGERQPPYLVKTTIEKNLQWAGVSNKYFAAVLIPKSLDLIESFGFTPLIDSAHLKEATEKSQSENSNQSPDQLKNEAIKNIACSARTTALTLNPQDIKVMEFLFYAGPKKKQELAVFSGWGLDKLLNYGWFSFVSKILLMILFAFYGFFGNYGWSIIFLTILMKVTLFPITKKGQVSMFKMQKLQPQLKALQAKHKDNKQKLGAEQLKLWKEHGINPLSGCLPMFFQIPVFIGLYWGLDLAIELRQTPFLLWIDNLSQPDQLMQLPVWFQSFPLIGVPYLHVLPILMTASWLIQSLTQPKSPDPQARTQQKMFTFMPIIFLFFFYNVPSGLTLFWFTSTLLGIVEQQIIKRVYMK
ncbi:MAG: membrane protein insertase YidC [Planctomycetes bacterium]|nr:membrane protein insertase YidC [Planctomycetota bacterium]